MSFAELHHWMDEPVKVLGPKHRLLRHDIINTPPKAKKLFGELADQACIDHIILDIETGEIKLERFEIKLVKKSKQI